MAQRDRPKDAATPVRQEAEGVDAILLAEPVIEIPPPHEEPSPAAAPHPARRTTARGNFLAALGGGALAALIGFGLSHLDLLGLTPAPQELSALADRIAVAEMEQARTSAELATLRATPAASDPALEDRLSVLETAITGTVSDPRVDGLIARIDAVEIQLANASAAGNGISGAALAALQAELRALATAAPVAPEALAALAAEAKAGLVEVEARTRTLLDEAQTIADGARVTAALGQLRAALDTGQPYTASIAMLSDIEIPPTLSEFAATGLPTLADLRAGFAPAARAALEAALLADPGESWSERVVTFLRSQTGARSLIPREGNDPDAVLSRAEAALAAADLDRTAQELAALPAEARAAMADWTGLVERRRTAASAIEALAAKTGG